MNTRPNVSLLIPVYNAEESLRLSLDSAAAQTLPELEILCLDDGSADGSAALCREYAERDGRFRLLRHEENRGSMAARKTLVEEARGAYIMFLDADDTLERDACQKAYERICREKTEIVQFGMAVDTREKSALLLPLLVFILFFECNTRSTTFRESNLFGWTPEQCFAISRDIVSQLQEADRAGAQEIVLRVPKRNGVDNWPFAYFGEDRYSAALYKLGVISRDIPTTIQPSEEYNRSFGLPDG